MIVVDTNVVSELVRPSPSAVVVGWVRGNERELYTTSITLAEIRHGIERLAEGRLKELLRSTAEEVSLTSSSGCFPSTRRRRWRTPRS